MCRYRRRQQRCACIISSVDEHTNEDRAYAIKAQVVSSGSNSRASNMRAKIWSGVSIFGVVRFDSDMSRQNCIRNGSGTRPSGAGRVAGRIQHSL